MDTPMFQSSSQVQTLKASQYLQQLCKHFSHKLPVEFDARHGSTTMPFGTCTLLAGEDQLSLTVSGDDTDKMEDVIGSHLERFAFCESLNVVWKRSTS